MSITLTTMVEQRVEVKTVSVHVKVCDSGTYELKTPTGTVIKDIEDYVPNFFPGEHYGDYLILDIDLETGQITNWKKPSAGQIEQAINGNDD